MNLCEILKFKGAFIVRLQVEFVSELSNISVIQIGLLLRILTLKLNEQHNVFHLQRTNPLGCDTGIST